MRLDIDGRAALVTGAASGIGRAVVAGLLAEGVRVAILDVDTAGLDRVVRESAAASARLVPVVADLTDEPAVAGAAAAAIGALGGLDIVIGCAGISGPVGSEIEEVALAEWNAVFAVNVTGSFLIVKHTLPALRASDVASVVLISSDSALVAAPGMVPYCASKAALLQFARALSVDLAADGIRVNAVCPSIVDTPMSRGDLGLERGFADATYPVQNAEEVADEVLFLASARSRAVNGTALVSDFGYTARSSFPA